MVNFFPGPREVLGTWQWYHHARSHSAANKTIVTINLDETMICAYLGNRGYRVSPASAATEGSPPEQASHAPLKRRRAYMSHIALVCDSPEHQHMLPQILLLGQNMITVADTTELKQQCPPNVFLEREGSQWSNEDVMVELIVLLALIFWPLRAHLDLVLTFDACRCHLGRKVFACARFHGIALSVIAANTTWLLQSLDTHVFCREKLLLKHAFAQCSLKLGTSNVPAKTWILALMLTIGSFFRTIDCSAAFVGNGFSPDQKGVRAKIMRSLRMDELPPITSLAPSVQQVKHVLPGDVKWQPDFVYKPLHRHLSQEAIAAGTSFCEYFNNQASDIIDAPSVSHTWVPRARLSRKSSLAQITPAAAAVPSSASASSAAGPADPPVPSS